MATVQRATEELAYADHTLAENAERIVRQRQIVAAMTDLESPEGMMAQAILQTLINAQRTVENLRIILVQEIENPIRH
jgi:uncharacterized protein Yka (UPF0111/DUF47 family)